MSDDAGQPLVEFKVWDCARQRSENIAATSLNDLIIRASEALGMPVARVCLEQDGTEVDEEEYFNMLEKDTPLMALEEGDRWMPFSAKYQLVMDKERGVCERSSIFMDDVEILGNMDPDFFNDIVPDKLFLEVVRDSCRSSAPVQNAAQQREAVN
ncbi:lipid transferase CIDEB-like [Cloeon dipterum]|uniref:CIDE-N domain-containing protein n=1 Tax=Cloeon dipterum TaxID=197152 RepID=A0A8S1CJE0_9INSE|nr:Hypothetical predicted protein [Cloeon dipterum]